MGLVQRKIEAAGLTTVMLSTIPKLTESVGTPRLVAIGHPQGLTMGAPGDKERQRAVLAAALQAASDMQTPGSVEQLPFVWDETKLRLRPGPAAPIGKYLQFHPWLLPKLFAREIPTDEGDSTSQRTPILERSST